MEAGKAAATGSRFRRLTRRIVYWRLPFRVVLGSAFWLAICVGSLTLATAEHAGGSVALFVFGVWAAASYALGFYVGNWWAIVAPVTLVVAFEALLVYLGETTSGNDEGIAFSIWIFAIVMAPIVGLVCLGVKQGERRFGEPKQPDDRQPGEPTEQASGQPSGLEKGPRLPWPPHSAR